MQDATEQDAPPAAAMVSTRVPSSTGRPAYVVHTPGTPIPAEAPACPATCWCQEDL